jgi:hypothetical protein
MAALTGIEGAGCQFSSVQLGLSSCVFDSVQFATRAFRALRMADVLPRCCPATRIRLLRSAIPLRAGPAQPVGSGVGRLRRGAGTFCDEVGHLALLQPTFHRRVDGDVQTGFRYEYPTAPSGSIPRVCGDLPETIPCVANFPQPDFGSLSLAILAGRAYSVKVRGASDLPRAWNTAAIRSAHGPWEAQTAPWPARRGLCRRAASAPYTPQE